MSKHWYRVDFSDGEKSRVVGGSSELDPARLMTELASAAFIRFDNLFYRDNQNRFRPWSEWEPKLQSIALINVKSISIIVPFMGDPREES